MELVLLVGVLVGVNAGAVLMVAGWRLACMTRQDTTPQPDVIYVLSEEGDIIEEADGRWSS